MKSHPVKVAFLILILLFLSLSQTACWDQREVESLGIILATGVDLAPDGRIKVIVQTINPAPLGGATAGGSMGGSTPKTYSNYSYEGQTISGSVRELSRMVPRQLFFAHNQVLIISDKLASDRGVQEILDFFLRNPQIRRTTWVLVTKGDLTTIMDEPGRQEKTPAQRIVEIINERNLNSRYAVQRIGEFSESLHNKQSGTYTAILERMKNKSLPEENINRVSEGFVSEPLHDLVITGTAVFKRDKMIGVLTPKESRGLLWIKGEVRGGTVEVADPEQENKKVSLEILRSKTTIKPELTEGQIQITLTLKPESNITEVTGNLDLANEDTIKLLESLQNEAIQNEIESVLDKGQKELQTDVFGFGNAIHRKYPQRWKTLSEQWENNFTGIPVSIHVESRIRRTGLITKPLSGK